MKQLTTDQWKDISTDEAYKLSQAEFKGMALQAFQDIRNDIHEMKQERAITRYISFAIAGLTGILSGLFGTHLH